MNIGDKMLTFERLREINVRRCETVFHKLNDWTFTDWATALAGETGEACNEIKKLRRLDGADKLEDTKEKRQELIEKAVIELADVVIYADLLAAAMGKSLADAVIEKFNIVSKKRGFPNRI